MRLTRQLMTMAALVFLTGIQVASAGNQVLAQVGSLKVTADELNTALASSPFADKFPSMDENDQAGLRGDMLRRLVAAKLLTLEAQRLGLDRTDAYRKDAGDFRLGLLYRAFMEKLRQDVVIPNDTLEAMKKQFKQDRDGLEAAKSAYRSERYKTLQRTTLQSLIKQDNVRLHEERIGAGMPADTLLAEGTGIQVRYGDLVDVGGTKTPPDAEWLKGQINRRVELLAAANAAENQGLDVSAALKSYEKEHLPAALMEAKTKEWVPDEKTLRGWYDSHPAASVTPERRHVGQLVVASQKEAEALRARIAKGESLFVLAGKYSVDPAGRKQKGDMGWILQGRGLPELDQALSHLKDGEISDVVKTRDGTYHLLTILERRPGRKTDYDAMRERIAQNIVNEKLPAYVTELEHRYGVTWNVLQHPQASAPQGGK